MKEILSRVVRGFVHSLFLSAVMGLIGLSLITGEFPPSWQHSKERLRALREFANPATMAPPATSVTDSPPTDGESVEKDLAELERIGAARARLGESILSGRPSVNSAKDDVAAPPPKSERSEPSGETVTAAQIRELQFQIFRLQNRVDHLERQIQFLHR